MTYLTIALLALALIGAGATSKKLKDWIVLGYNKLKAKAEAA